MGSGQLSAQPTAAASSPSLSIVFQCRWGPVSQLDLCSRPQIYFLAVHHVLLAYKRGTLQPAMCVGTNQNFVMMLDQPTHPTPPWSGFLGRYVCRC